MLFVIWEKIEHFLVLTKSKQDYKVLNYGFSVDGIRTNLCSRSI